MDFGCARFELVLAQELVLALAAPALDLVLALELVASRLVVLALELVLALLVLALFKRGAGLSWFCVSLLKALASPPFSGLRVSRL